MKRRPSGDEQALAGSIRVMGARENNLCGFDVEIPRGEIVAFIGVSGSGKSSLLHRTLASESAGRHEALMANSRHNRIARRPDCDWIEGLPFCLTVSQRALHRNPRSTVATFTGLHHVLQHLVIAYGEVHCECGSKVPEANVETLLDFLGAVHNGSRVTIGSVVAREPLPSMRILEKTLAKEGFRQVLIQPLPSAFHRPRRLAGLGTLDPNQIHSIAVEVGCLEVRRNNTQDLRTALERAHLLGRDGVLIDSGRDDASELRLDTGRQSVCPSCHRIHRLPDRSFLSFNSDPERSGRCSRCEGLGSVEEVALEALMRDPAQSIDEGCFALERHRGSYRHLGIREDVVRGVCLVHGDTTTKPFVRLRESTKRALLNGMGDERVLPIDRQGKKSGAKVRYHGLIPALRKVASQGGVMGDYARGFVRIGECDDCSGLRLQRDAVEPYVYRGSRFLEMLGSTVAESLARASAWSNARGPATEKAWVAAAMRLLGAVDRVGLGHLGINRSTSTLSGGELQRLKIAACLHRSLSQSCYVLDEPSLGLHASDIRELLGVLGDLRSMGNTILIADHDPLIRAASDRVVALGPGAGGEGGRLLDGSVPEPRLAKRPRLPLGPSRALHIAGASVNNLAGIEVDVPLGGIICLTGVSGSGKSSFVHRVLVPAVKAFLSSGRTTGPTWRSLSGGEFVRQMEHVGQGAIRRSVASVTATYLGIYDAIRELFAATAVARYREYSSSHFSFNRPEGRCPVCFGRGTSSEADDDTEASECSHCGGARFEDAVLDVLWQGLSIADILRLPASEAADLFMNEKVIADSLRLLVELGIGHLQLGRPTATLSGGEAQRLKLAASLARCDGHPEGLLVLLDEPTAGLHRADVERLLGAFERILDGGANTLVIIEHDLDIIAQADWVIDFGPGAGERGGHVVYAGPIEGLRSHPDSRTGAALRSRGRPVAAKGRHEPVGLSPRGIVVTGQCSAEESRLPERFRSALRKLDLSDADESEERLEPLQPAYCVAVETTSLPEKATLADAVGLTERFFKALLPHVQPSTAEGVHYVRDVDEAIAVARSVGRGSPVIAFSPITGLLEAGRATRSSALAALEDSARRGFEEYAVGGERRPLARLQRSSLDRVDLFSIRVVAGRLPTDGVAARALMERSFAAGHDWVVLFGGAGVRTGRESHLAARLIVPKQGLVGRQRMTTSLLDWRGAGMCPFCQGNSTLTTFEADLVVAHHDRPVLAPGFFTREADALFRAIIGRLRRTLEFFRDESISDLISAVAHRTNVGMLYHGYPYGKFLIPGRSGNKNVDFFEWLGIYPELEKRLHLSTNPKWRNRVETSRSTERCFACEGNGYQWQTQQAKVFGRELPTLLSLPLSELAPLVRKHLRRRGDVVIADAVRDLVAAGLGSLALTSRWRSLNADQRATLRTVSLKYLRLAEATHHVAVGAESVGLVKPILSGAALDSQICLHVASDE